MLKYLREKSNNKTYNDYYKNPWIHNCLKCIKHLMVQSDVEHCESIWKSRKTLYTNTINENCNSMSNYKKKTEYI